MYYKKRPSKKQVRALLDIYSQSCDEMRLRRNATATKCDTISARPPAGRVAKKPDKQKGYKDYVAK